MWTTNNRARYDRSFLRYPSDLTDDEWALVEPLIPPAKRGGDKRAVLVNSKFPDSEDRMRDLQEAARMLGLQVRVLDASTDGEIDMGFASLAEQRADALMVAADPFF